MALALELKFTQLIAMVLTLWPCFLEDRSSLLPHENFDLKSVIRAVIFNPPMMLRSKIGPQFNFKLSIKVAA